LSVMDHASHTNITIGFNIVFYISILTIFSPKRCCRP
jgi:hypothetical protein